jgi:hypothetical protein
MAALTSVDTDESDDSEPRRRALLDTSDRLLDRVEELRLADRVETPPALQEAIHALQGRLSAAARAGNASTLEAAHDLVFAVQERLLALNQRRPTPRSHPGRAEGSPIVASVGRGDRWKLLALPPRPEDAGQEESWRELVQATLERALDRWAYAHHHVGRAVRRGVEPHGALERARVAWTNYWELRREAERLGIGPESDGWTAP